MSKTRPSIAEILEMCERVGEAERTLKRAAKLERIGEHICRPVRRRKFSGELIECETCGEPMRETSVLKQIARRKI